MQRVGTVITKKIISWVVTLVTVSRVVIYLLIQNALKLIIWIIKD